MKVTYGTAPIVPSELSLKPAIGDGPLTVYPLTEDLVIVMSNMRLGNVFKNKSGADTYSFVLEDATGMNDADARLRALLKTQWPVMNEELWTPLVKRGKYLSTKPIQGFEGQLAAGKVYKIAVRIASVWRHGNRSGASLKIVAAKETREDPTFMFRE